MKKILDLIRKSPLVTEPAVNASTVQTWQGYASAAVVALLRFAVEPFYKLPASK